MMATWTFIEVALQKGIDTSSWQCPLNLMSYKWFRKKCWCNCIGAWKKIKKLPVYWCITVTSISLALGTFQYVHIPTKLRHNSYKILSFKNGTLVLILFEDERHGVASESNFCLNRVDDSAPHNLTLLGTNKKNKTWLVCIYKRKYLWNYKQQRKARN